MAERVAAFCGGEARALPCGATYPEPEAGRVVRRCIEEYGFCRIKLHLRASEFEPYLVEAERNPNVQLDSTMVFVGFDACGVFPQRPLPQLEKVAGQVLSGGDFPTIPYPFSHAVEGVLRLPFSGEAKQGILAGNAARLFGLPGAEPEGTAQT